MSSTRERLPRVRLAGVVICQDAILLVQHQRAGREYYLLPGGGLEWGETCAEGLAREFKEELSLDIAVGPLLFVNESIAPRGRRHILNLTFAAKIKGGALRLHPDWRLKAVRWVKRRELMSLTFYPEIRRALLKIWGQGFKKGIRLLPTPWK